MAISFPCRSTVHSVGYSDLRSKEEEKIKARNEELNKLQEKF